MPVKEEKLTEVKLDLKDLVIQKIYNFQDQRNTDSLLLFFDHKDPSYRTASAMAMASVQDIKAIEDLAILLNDEIDQVRIAAAYALGQTGDEKAEQFLINAFQKDDSLSRSVEFNKTVLEAVGKSASASFLNALSTISTYTIKDTALLEGQALGIYRYALRDIVSKDGTEKMIELVTRNGYPESVRTIAANYLSRAKNIQLDSFAVPLILAIGKSEDPRSEMALALALGKTKAPAAIESLKSRYRISNDYRVKCNILRAFKNFDYGNVKEIVLEAVKDPNPNVGIAASDYLLDKGIPVEAVNYWQMAKDTSFVWQVRSILYRAANRHLPPYFEATKGKINVELRDIALKSENMYERGEALLALSEFGWNYRFIGEQGLSSKIPIIRTKSAEAIAHIVSYPNFATWFGLGRRRVKREIADFFKNAISSEDAGMMYVAAETLAKKELGFSSIIDSTDFLQEALPKLSLPEEIETFNAVKKALDYLEGNALSEPRSPDYNNPIDWKYVTSLKNETRAVIVTRKGKITLRFFLDKTPASVGNFLRLAKTGYYDNKSFHRVVPNFVIQDGCHRGDGFGGEDFSIRSELPLMYYDKAGYIGMASAGKDTEGTQWFITHSPTPHLDGKYTIFGEVVEGIDIVHKIAVGDMIERVDISL